MSSSEGMRRGMIPGVKRDAKLVVTQFIKSSIFALETFEDLSAEERSIIKVQLMSYRMIARRMNWTHLEKIISRAIQPAPPPDPTLHHVWSP